MDRAIVESHAEGLESPDMPKKFFLHSGLFKRSFENFIGDLDTWADSFESGGKVDGCEE